MKKFTAIFALVVVMVIVGFTNAGSVSSNDLNSTISVSMTPADQMFPLGKQILNCDFGKYIEVKCSDNVPATVLPLVDGKTTTGVFWNNLQFRVLDSQRAPITSWKTIL